MKITIVSAAYPLRGGIAQHTGILYSKLKNKGHIVNVITFKRQYPGIFFPGKTQVETSTERSVKIETEPILDSISPLSWIRGYKRIKQLQPDLIIFAFWMPFFAPCFGTICSFAKKNIDAKILYLCHNIIPHEKRIGDIALTKFAFRRADYFIVQSKPVQKDLLSLLPKANQRLVPHPVFDIFGDAMDKNVAKREIQIDDEMVILFFGYVRDYKGLDLLLRAMPEILREFKVKLLVAGEFYEDENKYRKLIDQLNISESVFIYSNFVAYGEVSKYFSACDVVVLPYRSATQSGIVQLAYHLDKPCIVTDVGGLSEVVVHDQTGYVVEPENPKKIADAVIKFYSENKEKEFSENVRMEKKKYSWDNMIAGIEEFVK